MKRFFTLFTTVIFILCAHAQIAFIQLEDTYSSEADGGQCPELTAYNWFKENYVTNHTLGTGSFIKLSGFSTADLSGYSVIWLAIGRSLVDKEALLTLFNETNRNKLKAYIEAGGNVFLSGYASYLSHSIGRVTEDLNTCGWNSAYSTGNDDWSVKINSSGHKVWSAFVANNIDPGSRQDGAWYEYKLVGHHRNDRNCLWTGKNWADFQDNSQNCKIHGFWGNDNGPDGAGLVEFYPKGDFKGTIIVVGLAAYQWGKDNPYLANVKYLTQGILDYLSTSVSLSISVKANPVIKDEEDIRVTKSDNLTIKSYTTSDPTIANLHNTNEDLAGHIYYNYFGDVTFTVTAEGDGVNIPKNTVSASINRTVTGGAAATYGYILPFSIHTISANGYNGDGNYLPDYLAALWFYNEYVSQGKGCFINPAKASIPSQVKVLWINSDKNGLSIEDFDAAYASPGFVTALTNYVNTGGNLFLSKQAVRMLRKIGRYDNGTYPTYANGGYTENNDDWKIRNSFFVGEGAVDYSSHLIFKDIEESPFALIAGGGSHNHRTDNNNLIYDAVFNDKAAMQSFEDDYNCRILGTWPNVADNKCDRGVIAEFLPQNTTYGTIIEVGASAYQWNDKGTINLENVHPYMKKLTQNILEYLSTATVVVTEPNTEIPSTVNDLVVYQGGSVSNTGNITIRNSVTYIRPAVGGTAGNELGHWYTFCLPFNPSAVKVLDEDDDRDYAINSVYLTGSDANVTEPEGAGHFYLQTFYNYDGVDTHWEYIEDEGMPTKDMPYIIKFLNDTEDNGKGSALAAYFTANPVIKFIGGPQDISGTDDGTGGAPNGDYTYHVNHTLRKLTLRHVYPLNTATNMFEYDYGGTSTIMPFECYIKASTPALAAACPRFAIGRKATQHTNITTSIENLTAESHSPVFVYDITGRLCYEGMPQTLPSGIWIVRQGEMSKTIVIP